MREKKPAAKNRGAASPRGAVVADYTAAISHRNVFADALALVGGTPITVIVPVAGAARWRARVKIAGTTATLAAAYVRNKTGNAVYTANNPADVALADGVENKMESLDHMGETMIKFTLTPVGAGTVTYFDFMGRN